MSAYSITELSKTLNLTAPTLRYYEEIGLLPPVLRNTSGQRVYTEEHFDRLHAILCFKNAGMSIADIQKFFTYEANEQTHIKEMLELLNSYQKNTLERLHAEIKAYAICSARWNSIMPSRIPWTIKLPIPNGRIMISVTTWNRQSRIWSNYLFFSSPTIIIQY